MDEIAHAARQKKKKVLIDLRKTTLKRTGIYVSISSYKPRISEKKKKKKLVIFSNKILNEEKKKE